MRRQCFEDGGLIREPQWHDLFVGNLVLQWRTVGLINAIETRIQSTVYIFILSSISSRVYVISIYRVSCSKKENRATFLNKIIFFSLLNEQTK